MADRNGKLVTNKKASIYVIDKEDFQNDVAIKDLLRNIVTPSYQDPSDLLERELKYCNKLYLNEMSGKIVSFFLVRWEELLVNNVVKPAVFLGLSATTSEMKGTGIVFSLYRKFIRDAQEWEASHLQRIICWYTTATPSSYFAINALFEKHIPDADGTYSEESRAVAQAICYKKGWMDSVTSHPFVLHNIAKNTRYSENERKRIDKIIIKKRFDLFLKLDINEMRGDRLLCLCNIPS